MSKLILYFKLLLLIFKCYLAATASDYVGGHCKTSGLSGKCKLVANCPPALKALERTHTHPFKRCGFEGFDEIVCCPEVTAREPSTDDDKNLTTKDSDTVQQNRFTRRKCEQACEELSNEIKSKVDWHIIGGVDASIGEFPHMAALGYETDEGLEWDCSASIISSRYLLTAAHCIANIKRILPKLARLGVTKLNEKNPQDYTISNITVNPKYNPVSKHHDIAILKVIKEITFSDKVYPACLYFENNDPLGLIVTGWGKTSIGSEDDRSNILQKATLVAMPVRECNVSYVKRSSGSKTIVNSQLCAGSNVSDACWGDSGGPLQIQNKAGSYSIVGIISYGAGCGGKVPGVYTRVSKYLDWIESIVWL